MKRACVLGDGGWGTALSLCLLRTGWQTRLWSAFEGQARDMREHRENRPFLPGVPLPEELEIHHDPAAALAEADLVVAAVPTQFIHGTLSPLAGLVPEGAVLVSVAKGIEVGTGRRPSVIAAEALGCTGRVVVLAGPSHAEEVARGLPAALVAAGPDPDATSFVQQAFTSDILRVYPSGDEEGVELCGALKNVVAIAAGLSDGLGLGDNSKAALVARGLAEMARLGEDRGAQRETFYGLAGTGDLVTTCVSAHGRNRAFGEAVGSGVVVDQALSSLPGVVEGVETCRALAGDPALAHLELPITREVHAILFEGKEPRQAVADLMARPPAGAE